MVLQGSPEAEVTEDEGQEEGREEDPGAAGDAEEVHEEAGDEHLGEMELDGEEEEGGERDLVDEDEEWPGGQVGDGEDAVLVAVVDAGADAGGEPEEGEEEDVEVAPARADRLGVFQGRCGGGHAEIVTGLIVSEGSNGG